MKYTVTAAPIAVVPTHLQLRNDLIEVLETLPINPEPGQAHAYLVIEAENTEELFEIQAALRACAVKLGVGIKQSVKETTVTAHKVTKQQRQPRTPKTGKEAPFKGGISEVVDTRTGEISRGQLTLPEVIEIQPLPEVETRTPAQPVSSDALADAETRPARRSRLAAAQDDFNEADVRRAFSASTEADA